MIDRFLPFSIVQSDAGEKKLFLKSDVEKLNCIDKIKTMLNSSTKGSYIRIAAEEENQFMNFLPKLLQNITVIYNARKFFINLNIRDKKHKLNFVFENLTFFKSEPITLQENLDSDYIIKIAAYIKISKAYPDLVCACNQKITDVLTLKDK